MFDGWKQVIEQRFVSHKKSLTTASTLFDLVYGNICKARERTAYLSQVLQYQARGPGHGSRHPPKTCTEYPDGSYMKQPGGSQQPLDPAFESPRKRFPGSSRCTMIFPAKSGFRILYFHKSFLVDLKVLHQWCFATAYIATCQSYGKRQIS